MWVSLQNRAMGFAALTQITRKASDKRRIASRVIAEPSLLPQVMAGLASAKAAIKFGCAKVLLIISEEDPQLLYPQWDLFASQLESDNQIIRWGAIRIIGNLAQVDHDNRFEAIFKTYFAPIRGPVMITAANIIGASPAIVAAKPHLAGRIAAVVLKVEQAEYATAECRNVAIGHAITAFGKLFDRITDPAPILAFVHRQLGNSRNAVRVKAQKFLRKHAPEHAITAAPARAPRSPSRRPAPS